MAGKNGKHPEALDLTVWGISDTEVLGIVDDLADENGWVTTMDVRMQMGEPVEIGHHSGVGVRLGWMKRYGWLERGEGKMWRLTTMGHQILDNPNLSRAVENALGRLNPAQRLRLTRELAEGGAHSVEEIHTALRREWQRNIRR